MNTDVLKTYAPEARRGFIAAVTARAAVFGLTSESAAPMQEQGDTVVIEGKAYPKSIGASRRKLEERISRTSFDQVMDAMAYTWFNRFMAIRYMELHGYLDHGRRVLSHPDKAKGFQILDECADIDLPDLDKAKVLDLKLDATKEEELYRLLILGQCRALHEAMPFLFDLVDHETALLLPDNLTRSDSLIRSLVDEIPEENWKQIEIVGWLYQFYISEKKDEVIGKVVKSKDIPAATQLFTPNWIVKYMVQNSLGAQWIATYPDSPLKERMDYYIGPAEQTNEINAQLAAITPSQLNPEELTLVDPASGSGHILVEAYELFKAIYLERGYRQRDVPQLILEKNLFGLDIDERAAQLTGFALVMKGHADDRQLFERGVKLNVMALVDSADFDANAVAKGMKLCDYDLRPRDITELKRLFEHATTFGSLIQLPEGLAKKLPAMKQLSDATSQDLFVSEAINRLGPLVRQAELLAAQYDAVVANPPYMGGKAMNAQLKGFAREHFPSSKADLFAVAMERFVGLAKPKGFVGLMTPFTWMFLKSYEALRGFVLETETLHSLIEPEYHAFFDSAYVPVCTFVLQNCHTTDYKASFIKLSDFYGAELQSLKTLEAIRDPDCDWRYEAKPDDFKKIPGNPVAYWVSDGVRRVYDEATPLEEIAEAKQGLATADNDRFLRCWYEPGFDRIALGISNREEARQSSKKWFPYNKGGGFRRWYGNQDFVINWEDDGRELRAMRPKSVIRSPDRYFSSCLSWSKITSSGFAIRHFPDGFIFDVAGCSIFGENLRPILGCMNSAIMTQVVNSLSPTLNFEVGQVNEFPLIDLKGGKQRLLNVIDALVGGSESDWDAYERSWNFRSLPLLTISFEPTSTLKSSYTAWISQNRETIAETKRLEEENNRLFIDAYGLADELTPEVPIEQITLTVNPAYRYGVKIDEAEQWTRFRQDTMEELVSYAIGCMMGRYSLDEPGLIYANSGNEDFDPSQYPTYLADDDGIVPLTDSEWFDVDAGNRLIEFLSKAWDASHLEANLTFLADNLSPKKNESSRETLRRYLCDKFFKSHLQTYKKRPIYWLFTSGKQKAFQCLVYLHRYNEGTLARMRTEYVIPLQGLLESRRNQLENDISSASETPHRRSLEKERDKLAKQRAELQTFDEELRHLADQRISLDLDDGVKVNYGKFGDLLAEVKAVHGKKVS